VPTQQAGLRRDLSGTVSRGASMGPVTWQMCEVDTITIPTDCIKIQYAETETEPRSGKKSREPNRPLVLPRGFLLSPSKPFPLPGSPSPHPPTAYHPPLSPRFIDHYGFFFRSNVYISLHPIALTIYIYEAGVTRTHHLLRLNLGLSCTTRHKLI